MLKPLAMSGASHDSQHMATVVRRLLRSQMAAKGMEYKDLARGLRELGIEQHESTLRSKINTGTLGAQLFLYILLALGVRHIDTAVVREIFADVEREHDSGAE